MSLITPQRLGTEQLPAGHVLTLTLLQGSGAIVQRSCAGQVVASGPMTATSTYGPYLQTMTISVSCLAGSLVESSVAADTAAGLSAAERAAAQSMVSEDVIVARTRTWATLGAAADYIGQIYVGDVGPSGSLWRSDGANWGLVNGSVVLTRGHTDLTVTAASTSEEDLVSIPIPAGLMGANGMIEVTHFWEATNNANVKTMRVKLGGTAFFANASALGSSAIFLPPITRIWNRNSQSAQMAFAAANGNTTVATGTAKTTGTVDTSAATTLAISGQKATGSDTLTLLGYSVRLVRP